MTNNKCRPLLLCAVCVCSLLIRAQDRDKDKESPRAHEVLAAAHQASGLEKIAPYQLSATVVINPGAPSAKTGRITVYHDKDRSRYELQVEDYREVKLVLGSKLYLARSLPYPVPGLSQLQGIDGAWDRSAEDGDAKLSDVSHKKVQHLQADCFDVKTEQRHRLCFDPSRKVLLESLDQTKAIEFSDYASLDEQLFPRKITVLLELPMEERPVLTVDNIEVKKAHFDAAVFVVPEHSQEFETCENQQPARPVKTPNPEFSSNVRRRSDGASTVNVYAIVGKDGSLQNVMVLSKDPEVRSTSLETLKKWQYTPAMCGSTPVASELETQVRLFDMGGEERRSGRR